MNRQVQNEDFEGAQRGCGAKVPRFGIRLRKHAQGLFALLALGLAGCTLDPIDTRYVMRKDEQARPNRILVYDFAVTSAELPSDSPINARLSAGRPPREEQIALDSKLGKEMGAQLVAAIQAMGLPAERALLGVPVQAEQLVVRGCFVSAHVDKDGGDRLTVGFDLAASELLAMVETLRTTQQGTSRRLVSAHTPSGLIASNRLKVREGVTNRADLDAWATQAVKEIADGLKAVFQEQGWIQ